MYRHGAGFSEQECAIYGLHAKPLSHRRSFLSFAEMRDTVRPALNDRTYAAILDNKWVFARYIGGFGIPTPRTYGLFHPLHGRDEQGAPLRSAAAVRDLLVEQGPTAIVVKPVSGRQGQGVRLLKIVERAGEPRLVFEGVEHSISDIFGQLPTGVANRGSGHVIQEEIEQHHEISRLGPFTLNTIRLSTLLKADGDVAFSRPVIRLGRRGGGADNWEQGGIAVRIAEDGTLGEGIIKRGEGARWIARHPDTGLEFAGFRLPHWHELLDITGVAASLLPHVRSVGWDLVITPEGPSVLEGNFGWEIVSAQLHEEGFLDETVRSELRRMGLRDPAPTPTVMRAIQRGTRSSLRRVRRAMR
jgi:hypothetical protein